MPRVRVRIRRPFLRYKPGDVVMLLPSVAAAAVRVGMAAYEKKGIDKPPADKMIDSALNK